MTPKDTLRAVVNRCIAEGAPVYANQPAARPLPCNPRELATILAALRHWQEIGLHCAMLDIATDGGAFEPLTVEEIDTLCERINR